MSLWWVAGFVWNVKNIVATCYKHPEQYVTLYVLDKTAMGSIGTIRFRFLYQQSMWTLTQMLSGLWGAWVQGGSEDILLGVGVELTGMFPQPRLVPSFLKPCSSAQPVRGNVLPVCIKAWWTPEWPLPWGLWQRELDKATVINPLCLWGERLTAQGSWSLRVKLYVSLFAVSLTVQFTSFLSPSELQYYQ